MMASNVFPGQHHLQPKPTVAHMQDKALKAIGKGKRVVVIAGPGISEAAGVPSSSNGNTLDKLPSKTFLGGPTQLEMWADHLKTVLPRIKAAEPTGFHRMIDRIAKEGRLLRMYTQNFDGIEDKTNHLRPGIVRYDTHNGAEWPLTIQLHGSFQHAVCNVCGQTEWLPLESIGDDGSFPACTSEVCCKNANPSFLLPLILDDTIGDFPFLTSEDVQEVIAEDISNNPDVLIVVGTALKKRSAAMLKEGIKDIADAVERNNGLCIWINLEAPSEDLQNTLLQSFDAIAVGDCQDVAVSAERFMDWWAVWMEDEGPEDEEDWWESWRHFEALRIEGEEDAVEWWTSWGAEDACRAERQIYVDYVSRCMFEYEYRVEYLSGSKKENYPL